MELGRCRWSQLMVEMMDKTMVLGWWRYLNIFVMQDKFLFETSPLDIGHQLRSRSTYLNIIYMSYVFEKIRLNSLPSEILSPKWRHCVQYT